TCVVRQIVHPEDGHCSDRLHRAKDSQLIAPRTRLASKKKQCGVMAARRGTALRIAGLIYAELVALLF
ncbi:UNVERIFIED_CONTAM: hypothetical protein NY603_41060, partial [Bacteroidetes bacterium 56_B9]